MIDIIGMDPFSLEELRGVNLKNWGIFNLKNGWPDLNEIWYLEGTHVSELLFQILTRSVDIRGGWRGKSEILEKN